MGTKSSVPPGDWVGLAMARGVPGVDRDTPREEAIDRLIEWTALQCLKKYELAPGWTVTEVLKDLDPKYYRDEAAKIAAEVTINPPTKRAYLQTAVESVA